MAIEACACIAENSFRMSLNATLVVLWRSFSPTRCPHRRSCGYTARSKKCRQLFLELIMKKLFIFGLSSIAAAAMAAGPSVSISGNSDQALIMYNSYGTNTADGARARAQQNLSTNAGNINIKGDSKQTTDLFDFYVNNRAGANTLAQQSLSSNVGDVSITGYSVQFSYLTEGSITNSATGYGASAIQSAASNTSCTTCK